ncbi:MAG: hypothetical protein U9R08_03285 [Nanoarchaeota archaeon]|nr:hypothetical protein [Nanoarchaeota archaeon]
MTLNRPIIKKGILSFSYNYEGSREKVDKKVLRKYAKESRLAQKCRSHVKYRCVDDTINGQPYELLKFLSPLFSGIPIAAYSLMNALKSPLEKVAVVGGNNIKLLLDSFTEFFNVEPGRFVFAHEGDQKLSLGNSFWQGYKALQPNPDDMILFVPGDIPYWSNIAPFINDPDAGNHGAILHWNCKQSIFPNHQIDPGSEFFHRKFHFHTPDKDFKEPQIWMMNLSQMDWNALRIYGGGLRKGGSIDWTTPIMLVYGNGEEDDDRIPKHLFHGNKIQRLYNIAKFIASEGTQVLKKMLSPEGLRDLASIVMDVPVKSTLNHDDVNLLADVDSWNDWAFFYEMERFAANHNFKIYPHQNLFDFTRALPNLKKSIPLLQHWSDIVNQHYDRYGLATPYNKGVYTLVTCGEEQMLRACEYQEEYARNVKQQSEQYNRLKNAAQRHVVPIEVINLEKKLKD